MMVGGREETRHEKGYETGGGANLMDLILK